MLLDYSGRLFSLFKPFLALFSIMDLESEVFALKDRVAALEKLLKKSPQAMAGNFSPSTLLSVSPSPVSRGQELKLDITELSKKGDGIGKIGNFVIFVSGAKVGQKLRVRIKKVYTTNAVAEILGQA